MELILINENKLKIMMDGNDMKKYGLDENEFHLSLTNTRTVLSSILKNADIHTGFERLDAEDKLLIQLYPEPRGGCELFVTKLTLGDELFNEEEMPMTAEDERFLLPKPKGSSIELKRAPLTYSFSEARALICACRELKNRGFSGEATLYRLDGGGYYLTVACENRTALTCLSEFGELENTENSIMKTAERGKCIFTKNAVEILSGL